MKVEKPDPLVRSVLLVSPCVQLHFIIFTEFGKTHELFCITEPKSKIAEARPPKFIKPIRPQEIAEGAVCLSEVEVDSYPEASFSWLLDGNPVEVTFSFVTVCTFLRNWISIL